MAKFPEPPAASALARVPAETIEIAPGTLLWRLYFRGGRHPTTWRSFRAFGPTLGRFDHQLPPPRLQERMILYCAAEGATCLAEVFQDTRVIDRSRASPWLVGFHLRTPVTLLDLRGSWPTRAGASMAIATGPRRRAQRWAQVIDEAYPSACGLTYPSSMHANSTSVALWERGAPALGPASAFNRRLDDPALLPALKRIARLLGYGLR